MQQVYGRSATVAALIGICSFMFSGGALYATRGNFAQHLKNLAFAAAGAHIFRNAFVELKTFSNYCGRAVANRAAALSDVWVFTVARIRVYIIHNLRISTKIYDFCGHESVTILRHQIMENMSEHILRV